MWSYCQGLPIGFDIELHQLTRDPQHLTDALAIFEGIRSTLVATASWPGPGGGEEHAAVLYEVSCDTDKLCGWFDPPLPSACKCDNNAMLFKGIVSRYLGYLAAYLTATGAHPTEAAEIGSFLRNNSRSVLANNRAADGGYGLLWQGPVFGYVDFNSANLNAPVLDLFNALAGQHTTPQKVLKLDEDESGSASVGAAVLPPASEFPIGWFSSAVMGSEESFPPSPFRLVVKYWNNNPPENGTAAVLRYLEQAHDRGAHVVLELPRRWVATRSLAPIHAVVSAVCAHPAVAGFYMADEPDKARSWIAPSTLDAVAATVRAAEAAKPACADSPHPISAAYATLQEPGKAPAAANYTESTDVYEFDKYP